MLLTRWPQYLNDNLLRVDSLVRNKASDLSFSAVIHGLNRDAARAPYHILIYVLSSNPTGPVECVLLFTEMQDGCEFD